jgi:TIR domain
MSFDDLTSERVRQLLVTLLQEMDPEKYSSFFAYFAFGGGSGVLLIGVGQTPQRELEDLKGRIERADLLDLRDAGYIRLEDKRDGTFEGRLTKRAIDAYAEVKRESGAGERITSGDADMDDLAERLLNRVVRECGDRQVKRLKDLQVDMVKRGILGSGIEEQGKIKIAIAFMDEYVEGMMRELLALARKARGRLEKRDSDWIRRRIERDLDQLKTGQAGCYVKSGQGQRTLGDYIQRKKAGVKSELEIELRTAALEARTQATQATVVKDVFISHASEDKEAVAKPIAEELRSRGFTVWYDEYEIKLGDSIPKKIDEGLGSRFGIVVLSPFFFAKNWPKKELEALLQREADEGVKIILPVWHQVTAEEVRKHSKMLATKKAAIMSKGVTAVVEEIVGAIQDAGKA